MRLQVIKEQEVLGKDFKMYGDFEHPLFLAKDVAKWVEHSDVSMMLKNIDEDEKLIQELFVSGQQREMWFLTEDGFYEVLMKSRKPIAKSFKKEVKKILKEIRQTGSYTNNMCIEDLVIMNATALKNIRLSVEAIDNRLEDLESKYLNKEPLLLVAEKSERDALNQLVRKYAYEHKSSHASIYSMLYSEVLYRLKINVNTRAKNEGITPIEWIDNNNYTTKVLAIALEIFSTVNHTYDNLFN